MGIDRSSRSSYSSSHCLPCMRGSTRKPTVEESVTSLPHARDRLILDLRTSIFVCLPRMRIDSCCRERLCCTKVYPHAGIDPAIALLLKPGSLPRMRGDRPFLRRSRITKRMFTPHARGSTLRRLGTL